MSICPSNSKVCCDHRKKIAKFFLSYLHILFYLLKSSVRNQLKLMKKKLCLNCKQVPPTNQTKLEGEKAIFTCEAKAMPGNVTVRWFREGSPVREVASLETRVTIRKDGSLIINPVSADDSGQYLCEVSNGIGDPQSASAYLNVECKF